MNPRAGNIFGINQQRGFRLRCFLEISYVIAFVLLPVACSAQFIGFPCNGTKAECAAKFDQFCRTTENTAPNLFVPRKTRIWGVLIDTTGAVFAHPEPGLTLELRDPRTHVTLSSAHVGEMGVFNLGTIPPGTYRLIVNLVTNGKETRYRGWQQPGKLACPDADECTLATLLRPGSTDNPIDFCPPEQ